MPTHACRRSCRASEAQAPRTPSPSLSVRAQAEPPHVRRARAGNACEPRGPGRAGRVRVSGIVEKLGNLLPRPPLPFLRGCASHVASVSQQPTLRAAGRASKHVRDRSETQKPRNRTADIAFLTTARTRSPRTASRSAHAGLPTIIHTAVLPQAFLTNLCCPITHETFIIPVQTEHGHTFEKSAILKALLLREKCPLTGLDLFRNSPLVINYAMKDMVRVFIDFQKELPAGWVEQAAKAAVEGDAEYLRAYVSGGVPINNLYSLASVLGDGRLFLGNPTRCSLLHLAVLSRSPEAIQLLLNRGIDATLTDSEGRTAAVWHQLITEEGTREMQDALRTAMTTVNTLENRIAGARYRVNVARLDRMEFQVTRQAMERALLGEVPAREHAAAESPAYSPTSPAYSPTSPYYEPNEENEADETFASLQQQLGEAF